MKKPAHPATRGAFFLTRQRLKTPPVWFWPVEAVPANLPSFRPNRLEQTAKVFHTAP